MGAGEGTVGQGEHGHHHEEHRHPDEARVDVAVPVKRLVPREIFARFQIWGYTDSASLDPIN